MLAREVFVDRQDRSSPWHLAADCDPAAESVPHIIEIIRPCMFEKFLGACRKALKACRMVGVVFAAEAKLFTARHAGPQGLARVNNCCPGFAHHPGSRDFWRADILENNLEQLGRKREI